MTSQEYLLNARVPQCSIVVPTLFLLHINNLPDDIYSHAIYADDTTLHSKCDQSSVLWQQIVLGAELETDLQDTMDWCKKWLVDFAVFKTFFCLLRRLVQIDRQLLLIVEQDFKADLQDTVDWCKKWLVDFAMSLKLSFVCYKDWYKLIDNYC